MNIPQRSERTPEQEHARNVAYWLLVIVVCVTLSMLGSCATKPPNSLGIHDVEQPGPRFNSDTLARK